MIKLASDLTAGDLFPSPRSDEGVVRAVCDYGKCTHDPSRYDSIHVRATSHPIRGNEFFIALYSREELHCCSHDSCFLDNPVVHRLTPWGDQEEKPHIEANAHAQ